MQYASTKVLPDIQNSKDGRGVPIDKVGICDLSFPITVLDRQNQRQQTIATISMSVSLPHHFKGTHMSRFLEILSRHQGEVTMRTLPSFAVYCGLWVLLAEMGRDLGRNKQPGLWKSWGGPPSSRMLRHRDTTLDPITLARYHAYLAKPLDRRFPSNAEELADPAAADALYESAIKYLLEATRDDTKFPLVLKENTSYGFRRNLWGMKPAAIIICVLGLAACIIPIAQALWANSPVPPLPVSMAICAIFLLVLWFLRVNPSWVRLAADAYALRLLAACDQLAATMSHTQTTPRIITK